MRTKYDNGLVISNKSSLAVVENENEANIKYQIYKFVGVLLNFPISDPST
jgi:hypothetical protein